MIIDWIFRAAFAYLLSAFYTLNYYCLSFTVHFDLVTRKRVSWEIPFADSMQNQHDFSILERVHWITTANCEACTFFFFYLLNSILCCIRLTGNFISIKILNGEFSTRLETPRLLLYHSRRIRPIKQILFWGRHCQLKGPKRQMSRYRLIVRIIVLELFSL